MRNRKQTNLSALGLTLTLIGLLAMLIVPVGVIVRVQQDIDKIERLETVRQKINDALQIALESRDFLLSRYMETDDVPNSASADRDYADLRVKWNGVLSEESDVVASDPVIQRTWKEGTTDLGLWLNDYLQRYTSHGDYGSTISVFTKYNTLYKQGIDALRAARKRAEEEQNEMREKQQDMHALQIHLATPLTILCFGLACLAWMNLRSLQQSWKREQEARGQLEIAIKESNHRIKNNLQVIGALIDMQMQEPGDTVPKTSLNDIVHQVRAVAAVHDFFSHELRSDQIQGDQMLLRLVELTASPIGLQVKLEAQAIALAVKQATAVALITNELLLNSGKHGATEARIAMSSDGKMAHLQVTDNGPGFPPDFDPAKHANLGLTLVEALARHDLKGELTFANHQGAQVDVAFPLEAA